MYGGKLMFGQHDDQQSHDDSMGLVSSSTDNGTDSAPVDDATAAPTPEPSPLNSGNDDLLDIKQHALSQLSPLVTHLDQNPEERFHTLMMMIQASDNQQLIKSAYDAASQISDDKQKAQALLDIVNEINYFTHPHNDK
ncbi:MAG: hypothetical protein ACREF7_04230 [Candidatus Saccharimonadales bacterium]